MTALKTDGQSVDCLEQVRLDPVERFAVELFGMGVDEMAAALDRIPPAAHREWFDQRLAEQGFVRDADGRLHWPRTAGVDDE